MNVIEILQGMNSNQIPLHWTKKEQNEAIEMAVDAVKKQIPQQQFYEYDTEFICSCCGAEVEENDITILKFCPECGQRLKW